MKDNTSKIVEDVVYALFGTKNFDSSYAFKTWIGNGQSFIIKDADEQEYRITVTREQF